MSAYAEPWYRKLPNDATDAIYGPDANAQQASTVRNLLGPANPLNIPGAINEGVDTGVQGYKNGDARAMIAGAMQAGGAAWPMAGRAARSMGNAVRFEGRNGIGPDLTREMDMISQQSRPTRAAPTAPGAGPQVPVSSGSPQGQMRQQSPASQSSSGQSSQSSLGANGQASQPVEGRTYGAPYSRDVYGAESDRTVNRMLDELAAARPADRAQMMSGHDPYRLEAVLQQRYQDAGLPLVNGDDLGLRASATMTNLQLAEDLLRQGSAGRSVSQPAVRESVMRLVTGRPGTLAIAGAAGGSAAMQPGDMPFDREQYNRWIAEQIMQGQQ